MKYAQAFDLSLEVIEVYGSKLEELATVLEMLRRRGDIASSLMKYSRRSHRVKFEIRIFQALEADGSTGTEHTSMLYSCFAKG
jgi:hypothetical protein